MFHHVFAAMHSRLSMVLPGVDILAGERLAREIQTLVGHQERLMNRFDAQSPLADLNRRASREPVKPPPELWDILQTCRAHHQRTHGAFDIAQTARTDLWRQADARGIPPAETELAAAASNCGMHQVHFDAAARTVRFATPGLLLDLGAIGKGIALQNACRALRDLGVRSAFLSFGESSVAVIGTHPAGPCWPVSVVDLFDPARSWHRFELRDAAMSTSGNRSAAGHIVNPRDGHVISGHRTLSVACASAVDAEVLSTALLVLPESDRAAVLRQYPRTHAAEIGYENDHGTWTGRMMWQYGT